MLAKIYVLANVEVRLVATTTGAARGDMAKGNGVRTPVRHYICLIHRPE